MVSRPPDSPAELPGYRKSEAIGTAHTETRYVYAAKSGIQFDNRSLCLRISSSTHFTFSTHSVSATTTQIFRR